MIRIHKDNVVPKYSTGKWSWNNSKDKLNFSSWENTVLENELNVSPSNGYKCKATINQIEEVIFRQEFARKHGHGNDVIRLEDIKNLVLFLAPSEILSNKFITFIHTKSLDRFFNALTIYFEYFLRLVEFILIRRDEVSGQANGQVQSMESTKIKRIFSEHLSQYRILLAREYSEIVMGNGEMSPFYHLNTLVKISKTYQDRSLHEALLAFATQIVWIAHHRKAFDTIDDEMNRLFRSDHFKLTRKDSLEFSPTEQELLFGQNYKRVNFRTQNSPLVQEIASVQRKNLPILWIGVKKYRGTDLRVQQLEMEFIIPDSDLCLIDVKHGILGNPKALYTTMLTIDEEKLRERGHSENYDPYWLIRQPYLEIPKFDEIKQMKSEHLESYFLIRDNRFQYDKNLIKKWKRRDNVIDHIKSGGLVIDVVERCKKELAGNYSKEISSISVAEVTQAFLARKKFLRKK